MISYTGAYTGKKICVLYDSTSFFFRFSRSFNCYVKLDDDHEIIFENCVSAYKLILRNNNFKVT